MPAPSIEHRRKLALRPCRITLPEIAEQPGRKRWHIDRAETADVPFVKPQELSARRQVVVDHVENLAIHSWRQARQHDGLRTVVHIAQWHRIAAAQMQENAERVDPHSPGDPGIARAVYISGSHDDIRKAKALAVIDHQLVLFHLRETVRVATQLWPLLNRTGLVQQTTLGLVLS